MKVIIKISLNATSLSALIAIRVVRIIDTFSLTCKMTFFQKMFPKPNYLAFIWLDYIIL